MFANGTEFAAWCAAWCASCLHEGDDCDVMTRGLCKRPTPEWRRGPLWSPQTTVMCTAFEARPREPRRAAP